MRFNQLISPEMHQRMVQAAREFRKEPTAGEAILWRELRHRKLEGHKFRRQQPVGPFVVDFYCDEAALVIEVDGPIHRQRLAADRERQQLLEGLSLRVLRVGAEQVETNIEGVLSRIRRELTLTPSPSPTGRGASGSSGEGYKG